MLSSTVTKGICDLVCGCRRAFLSPSYSQQEDEEPGMLPQQSLQPDFTIYTRLSFQSIFALYLFPKHISQPTNVATPLQHPPMDARSLPTDCPPPRKGAQRPMSLQCTHGTELAMTNLVLSEVLSYFCWRQGPQHRVKGGRKDPPCFSCPDVLWKSPCCFSNCNNTRRCPFRRPWLPRANATPCT